VAVSTGIVAVTTQSIGAWSLSASFLQYQDRRGLQVESFGALPFLWLDRLGLADYQIEFEFGAQQISGPGTAVVAAACSLLMVLGIVSVLWYMRIRRLASCPEMERLVVLLTLCVSVLVVTNKVFSGQYLLWLVLVIAAQAGYRAVHRRTLAAAIVACGLTHAYFPFMYGALVSGDLLPLTLLTVRDAVLVYLIWQLWSSALQTSSGDRQSTMMHDKVSA
jgi:hypothetical protein